MELSILIPANSEMFLSRTIQDILEHIEADTEIIATLDGKWADPEIPQNDRVNIIYVPESVGQRGATNLACKLAKGKYVMKVDAHCSFDQGFDRKMLEAFKETGDNVVMAPLMRNLWAFDWKCMKCGKKTYQGITPTKCENCDNTTKFKRKMMWISKKRPESTAYCFDPEPHFQYHGDQRKKQVGDIVETMSLQGSAWMMTREKYWDLNVCDEAFGSWGSQGIEISCKFWLSGGRVLVNKKTFYSHLFRTKGGDFGFPYPQSGKQIQNAKKYAKELFFENKWPKQIYSLSWLVEKFLPIPGWGEKELAGIKRFDLPSHPSTLVTTPASSNGMNGSKLVPPLTDSLSGINSGRSIAPQNVSSGKNEQKMSGITTTGNITEMVKDLDILPLSDGNRLNKPSIHKPVNIDSLLTEASISIPAIINTASPQPAPSFVEVNMGKNLGGFVGTDIGNNK